MKTEKEAEMFLTVKLHLDVLGYRLKRHVTTQKGQHESHEIDFYLMGNVLI